jgi:hypothetical protein
MHTAARKFVEQVAARLKMPRRFVLEIGSRDINGSVRDLFVTRQGYLGTDIAPGAGVDMIADGADVLPPTRPDTVICCEVLEHAENAEAIVGNAIRLLTEASGSVFIMTCAGEGRRPHSAIDGGEVRPGEFYRNVSSAQFHRWVKRHGGVVQHVEEHPNRGDLYAVVIKAK